MLGLHANVKVIEISPLCGDGILGPKRFCTLMDELQTAVKYDPDEGFYHNRASIVQAYGERRLYGLEVNFDEWFENKNDPVFMDSKHETYGMLPCFTVIEKTSDDSPSTCQFVWTANRAKKKGFAQKMMDGLSVQYVDNPPLEAAAFWPKHFSRVQVDIDKDDAL